MQDWAANRQLTETDWVKLKCVFSTAMTELLRLQFGILQRRGAYIKILIKLLFLCSSILEKRDGKKETEHRVACRDVITQTRVTGETQFLPPDGIQAK